MDIPPVGSYFLFILWSFTKVICIFFFAFPTMVDLHLNELSSLSLSLLYIYIKRDIENKYGVENKDLKPFV